LQADVPQGVIRVQAPHLSKVSMAIQLTEDLKASDIVARFLSEKRYKYIFVLLTCILSRKKKFKNSLNQSEFVNFGVNLAH